MPGSEKPHRNPIPTTTDCRRDKIVYYPGASQQLGTIRNQTITIAKRINIDNPQGKSNREEGFISKPVSHGNIGSHHESKQTFELDWVKNCQRQHSSSRISLNDHKNATKSQIELRATKEEQHFARQHKQLADNRYLGKMQTNPGTGPSKLGLKSFQGDHSTTLNFNDTELNTSQADDQFESQILEGQMAEALPEVKQRLSNDYNQLDEPILDTLMRDLKGIYNKMKIIALPLSSYDIYKVVLRGWDLWGPLILCTFLAFNLHHSSNYNDNHIGPHFADIFVLVWFGSCLVSLNYRLLSISTSEGQSSMMMRKPMSLIDGGLAQSKNSTGIVKTGSDSLGGSQADVIFSHEAIEQSSQSKQQPSAATFQTLMSPPSIFQLMCVFGYCLVAPCFGLILLKIFPFNRLLFERAIVGLLFGFAWPTFCSVRILIRYQHPEKRALAIYPIGLFYFVLSCMIILNH